MLRHEKEDGKKVTFSAVGSYKRSVYVIPDEDMEKAEVIIRDDEADYVRVRLALDAIGIKIGSHRDAIVRWSERWQRWEPLGNYDCELLKNELTDRVTEVTSNGVRSAFNMGYVDWMVALTENSKRNKLDG